MRAHATGVPSHWRDLGLAGLRAAHGRWHDGPHGRRVLPSADAQQVLQALALVLLTFQFGQRLGELQLELHQLALHQQIGLLAALQLGLGALQFRLGALQLGGLLAEVSQVRADDVLAALRAGLRLLQLLHALAQRVVLAPLRAQLRHQLLVVQQLGLDWLGGPRAVVGLQRDLRHAQLLQRRPGLRVVRVARGAGHPGRAPADLLGGLLDAAEEVAPGSRERQRRSGTGQLTADFRWGARRAPRAAGVQRAYHAHAVHLYLREGLLRPPATKHVRVRCDGLPRSRPRAHDRAALSVRIRFQPGGWRDGIAVAARQWPTTGGGTNLTRLGCGTAAEQRRATDELRLTQPGWVKPPGLVYGSVTGHQWGIVDSSLCASGLGNARERYSDGPRDSDTPGTAIGACQVAASGLVPPVCGGWATRAKRSSGSAAPLVRAPVAVFH
eukprot:scaffold309_cov235-Pinguiococcus_pyrenoidosus.AAC.28